MATTREKNIAKRIAVLEKKLIVKNRELEIEAALERVRTVAMDMKNPDDLLNICQVLFKELKSLGFDQIRNTLIHTFNDHEKNFRDHDYSDLTGAAVTTIPYSDQPIVKKFLKEIRKSEKAFSKIIVTGRELKDWKKFRRKGGQKHDVRLNKARALHYYIYSVGNASIGISTFNTIDDEKLMILRRFRNVFELAYQRYNDIAIAGAQAREAQIEAALEKVRSRSLAMHKSDELKEVVAVLFQKLQELDFEIDKGAAIVITYSPGSKDCTQWITDATQTYAVPFFIPFTKHTISLDQYSARKKGLGSYSKLYAQKEIRDYFGYLFKHTAYNQVPQPVRKMILGSKSYGLSIAFEKNSGIAIPSTIGKLVSGDEMQILKRFSKVFEQSYTRFLDLQKAEAQAREAKIEAALERVRARTMGMHSSSELSDVIKEVTDQIQLLGFDFDTSNIGSQYDEKGFYLWNSVPDEPVLAGVYVPKKELKIINWFYGEVSFLNKVRSILFDKKDTRDFFKYYLSTKDGSHIPDDRKKFLISVPSISLLTAFRKDFALSILNYRGIKYSDEDGIILSRFANVFEQSYTRFLDLQKAEAQVREVQIEAGMERVRSKTMAMHKSFEVTGIAVSLNEELLKLGFEGGSTIMIMNRETGNTEQWTGFSENKTLKSCFVPHFKHPYHDALFNSWKRGEKYLVYTVGGNEKKSLDAHYFSTGYKDFPESDKKWMRQMRSVTFSHAFMKYGAIHWGPGHLTEEQLRILERFSKVFEQSYTRFLDLQRAEAQAREAEIELALERVRAKTMAMQRPSEFVDVVNVIGQQFVHLGFDIEWANFGANGLDVTDGIDTWNFAVIPGGEPVSSRLFIPRFDHPLFIDAVKQLDKNRRTGDNLFVMSYGKKDKDRWLDHLFTKTIFKDVPDEYRAIQYAKPGYTTSNLALKDTFLSIGKFDTNSFTDEQHNILKRIGNAFGQAYTRFQDLQKAEAQAKEAQIEAALERVRARAMAMQNSDELKELIGTVFTELTKLDLVLTRCVIMIFDLKTNDSTWWMANSEDAANPIGLAVNYHEQPPYLAYINAWKERKIKWQYVLEGKIKKEWDDYIFSETELSQLPDFVIAGMRAPDRVYLNVSFNNFGNLTLASLEPLSDDHFDILLRFAKVFDLTYTRFNDLQQAEAQARESRIQLALERVRARTMAMQKSDELPQAANLLFQQIQSLGMPAWSAGYCIWGDDKKSLTAWMSSEGVLQPPFKAPTTEDELFIQMREGSEQDKMLHVVEMGGKKLVAHYKYMRTLPVVGEILDSIIEAGHPLPTFQIMHHAYFSQGFLLFITYEPVPEAHDIFKRFAKVFDQTYTRFLDLQKAEAQAKESQIQLALERVRARTMAMQRSDELPETSFLLFQQLQELGETTVQNSIAIVNEEAGVVELSTTVHGHHMPHTLNVPIDDPYVMAKAVAAWKAKRKSLKLEFRGQELKDYNDHRNSFFETKVNFPEDQWLVSIVFFSQGWLSFSSDKTISIETFEILERFAAVFEQTYTRFLDLQKAEVQAKESQIQLALERVRARTMAMQHSNELKYAATLLFQQVKALGVPAYSCGYNIWEKGENEFTSWMSTQDGTDINGVPNIPLTEDANFIRYVESKQNGEPFFVLELRGERMQEHYQYLKTIPAFQAYFDYAVSVGFDLPKTQIHHIANFSQGNLLFITLEPCPEFHDVFKRFAAVFEQTYTRFLDLQKAEAQAREGQIQLALERVRARTMAMQRSDELPETTYLLYQQFKELDASAEQFSIGIINEEEGVGEMYATVHGYKLMQKRKVSLGEPIVFSKVYAAWKEGKKSLILEIAGEELRTYNKYRNEIIGEQIFSEKINSGDKWIVRCAFFSKGILSFSTSGTTSKETLQLLERFAKVFDGTYTRFLDLQRAEAQARESQIQLALERVRARTMAMQKSEELSETSYVLFQQFKELGESGDQISIGIFEEDEKAMKLYSTFQGSQWNRPARIEFNKHRVYQNVYSAWKERKRSVVTELTGDELQDLNKIKLENPDYQISETQLAKDHWAVCTAFFSNGILSYASHESPQKESIELLERFANVFDLTYTRFLDLQNAEAQAREAQIEASLERVRSRSLAMHNTSELQEVIHTVHKEMLKLNIAIHGGSFIAINNDIGTTLRCWGSGGTADTSEEVYLPLYEKPFCTNLIKRIKNGPGFFTEEYTQKEKKDFFTFLFQYEPWSKLDPKQKEETLSSPGGYTRSCCVSKHTSIFIINHLGEKFSDADNEILKRFGKVFEQSYTRFLDLQKAEAQAKESQIEAALERVRAVAMAMRKPEELMQISEVIFKQIIGLGFKSVRNVQIAIDEDDEKKSYNGVEYSEYYQNRFKHVPYNSSPLFAEIANEIKKSNNAFYQKEITGQEFEEWRNWRTNIQDREDSSIHPELATATSMCFYLHSVGTGMLGISTFAPITNDQLEILKRFKNVFELSYRRYIDIEKAEAQTREAQIELALERVRARTMAMHRSEELAETAQVLFHQLNELGAVPDRIAIGIADEINNVVNFWSTDQAGSHISNSFKGRLDERTVMSKGYKAWKDHQRSLVVDLQGDDLKEWIQFAKEEMKIPVKEEHIKGRRVHNFAFFSHGWILVTTHKLQSAETLQTLERFASVFSLTYRRFLDLQKAEEQAKEAQIELGLERVRARTMAMQKSDELADAAQLLYHEFGNLGINTFSCGYMFIDEAKHTQTAWVVLPDGSLLPNFIVFPLTGDHVLDSRYKDWKEKKPLHTFEIQGEVNKEHHRFLSNYVPPFVVEDIFSKIPDRIIFHCANFSDGYLLILATEFFSPEEQQTIIRFAKVFEMTYTRFNDLKQAEEQARESQIQLAMERVRARTMAMQKSDELAEVASLLFTQIADLGTNSWSSGFIIFQPDELSINSWMSKPDGSMGVPFNIPITEDPFFIKIYEAYKRGEEFFVMESSGKELEETYKYMFSLPGAAKALGAIEDLGFQMPTFQITHCVFFPTGFLMFITYEPCQEMWEIFKRFGKVFEQAYTRFLDLQKAEEQAREARIEAVLERIRSRTMAMQKSDELTDVAGLLFKQVTDMGIKTWTAGFNVWSDDNNSYVDYITSPNGGFIEPYTVYTDTAEALTDISNARKSGVEFDMQYVEGEKIKQLYLALTKLDEKQYEIMLQDGIRFPSHQYEHFVFGSKVSLMFITYEPVPEAHDIFKRLGKVFEQTYTRFLDLQKAEAQARESQIQLALERVRARTMAMQKSDELPETSLVLYEQLKRLGEPAEQLTIGVVREENNVIEISATLHGGVLNKIYWHSIDEPFMMNKIYRAWKTQQKTLIVELKGDQLNAYNKYRNELTKSEMFQTDFDDEHRRIVYAAFFSKGMLAFAANEPRPPQSLELLERFASVFDLTYTRFLDLQRAEAQAREAQIEAALEKVRSRSLAMHKSDELQEVVNTVYERLQELNIEMDSCNIAIFKEGTRDFEFWIASPFQKKTASFRIAGDWNFPLIQNLLAARESGQDFFSECFSFEEKNRWFEFAFNNTDFGRLPDERKKYIFEQKAYALSIAFAKNTGVQVNTYSGNLPSEKGKEILIRFSKVFEQAYIRFLDLQKAESQAREAQIEAALERVRSSSLAMHKSEELKDVVKIVFDNFRSLGLQGIDSVNINILHGGSREFDLWLAAPGQDYTTNFHLPYFDHPIANDFFSAVNRGETVHTGIYDYDSKNKYFGYMFEYSDNKYLPEERKKIILSGRGYSVATGIAKHSSIFLNNYNGETFSEETNGILVRFSKVFDQAYTRFLDLQKAEAQAREAQIESSLERVRSKTMAMHNSNDVGDTVATMFAEFVNLGIETVRCGIAIIHDVNHMEVWTAKPDENGKVSLTIGTLPMTIHPMLVSVYEHWKNKESQTSYELIGEDLKNYFREINNSPDYPIRYDIDTLPNRQMNTAFYFPEGCLFAFSHQAIPAEPSTILKRFAGVFGQTYRRYLDLLKAEAQAREAQIEVALERVRAKAMAMHKSEDLNAAVATVFEELDKLDLGVLRCGISILDKEKRTGDIWVTSITDKGSAVHVSGDESFDIHPLLQGAFEAWLKKEDFYYLLKGDDLTQYYKAVKAANFHLPESQTEFKQQYCYTTTYGAGGLFAFRETEFPAEAKSVMRRFAGVFDLTYKRFLDLQKAEANAREAQIEAGLERVRARTMAMHSSDDVGVATATMFTELEKLGIENLRGGITIIKPDQTQEVWSVTNMADGRTVRAIGVFDMKLHPLWRALLDGKLKKDDYLYYWMAGQDKEDYINILNATPNYLTQPIKEFPDVHVQSYFFGEGAVWTNSLQPHSEEDKQVVKRFASVFSLTFRRYQDLKKAEAQAREAQIEMALEKVRASTMAMQKSEDLSQAAFVLFKQFKELGESPERIFIATFDSADENLVDLWGTNQGGNQLNRLFRVSASEPTVIKKIVDAWKEKKTSIVIDLKGDELHSYLKFLENTGIPVTPGIMTERRVQTVACFSKGVIGVTTPEPEPVASMQLLERFANVFDLTYTRFLDLLQAEAQAREATIEAALEKVRGKAMAMHNSNDLAVTASMIFIELRKLGINPIRCGVGLLNKESRRAQLYSAGDNLSLIGWVHLTDHPVLEKIYNTWLANEEYYPELEGEQMRLYYEQLLKGLPLTAPDTSYLPKHYGHFIPFSIGCLYAWADQRYDDADIRILKRFASIIDLTFRRYIELQKSEANAREAVKQAALDRVRADIASMRTIEDLDRITPLIWNELTILGIPFIRCGVFIMDETQQFIHTFLSTPDGKAIGAFHLPYDTPGNIQFVLGNWREKKKYVDHWDEKEFYQFAEILERQGALDSAENYLKTIPHGGFYLHFLPFLQGMLYVGNTTQLSGEMVDLVQAVADAFSTAYARYEDFNRLEAAKKQVENTLSDLKQAQQQLVQSEKMASLGELTAGIAHEIQNPLNFVNNFSDVSSELLEEMKNELEKGNKDDAIAIVEDVKQNLEKILHHGKRADAIVKGMLQHSRISSGQKEMTDVNSLTDEYLRLAFHGLRAKDKTFNAKFETHFDSNIEKINIIPQDIGRVILNLINNAFYAVTEKKKVDQNGYEPTVTVSTQKDNGKIEIKVKDNGNGIPQKILDKIFQPFFTTKPTGQGTGLGLSLAYDIVTKGHGGELKVETKEGDGSEFVIQLPA